MCVFDSLHLPMIRQHPCDHAYLVVDQALRKNYCLIDDLEEEEEENLDDIQMNIGWVWFKSSTCANLETDQ